MLRTEDDSVEWLNIYGIVIVAVIMIPNIILSIKDPAAFESPWKNKLIEILEQIGRFACIAFIVINIPRTCFALPLGDRLPMYIGVNSALLVLYLMGWAVFAKKDTITKALWLSAIPAAIFLFSGLCILSLPLIIASVLFGIGHITLSVKNCIARQNK